MSIGIFLALNKLVCTGGQLKGVRVRVELNVEPGPDTVLQAQLQVRGLDLAGRQGQTL